MSSSLSSWDLFSDGQVYAVYVIVGIIYISHFVVEDSRNLSYQRRNLETYYLLKKIKIY